MRDDDMNPIAE